MVKEIILASKSGVRKKILEENNIQCKIEPSNVDEDSVKESLIKEKSISSNYFKKFSRIKGQQN